MIKLSFGVVALSALVLVGIGGCKKSAPGSSTGNLGTVDGAPITNDEFYSYMAHKPMVQVVAQGRPYQLPVAGSLGVQAMRDVVQQKMLAGIAKDEGLFPTDADIQKEIAFRQKENANYIENLQSAGLTMDDIKNDTLNELISERLQTKGVVVSDDEAKTFIKTNQAQFTVPPQATVLVIGVPDAKKKAADTDLKSGQSFAAVAMQYSILPRARETRGELPTHDVSQMTEKLQAIVKATQEGKASSWEKDGQSWLKFYIEKKSPAKPMPVTPTLIEEVKRKLAEGKGAPNKADLEKRIIEKIKSAKVDLSSPYYQKGWDQYKDQLSANAGAQAPPTAPSAAPKK